MKTELVEKVKQYDSEGRLSVDNVNKFSNDEIVNLINFVLYHRNRKETDRIAHMLFALEKVRAKLFVPQLLSLYCEVFRGIGIISFLLKCLGKNVVVPNLENAVKKAAQKNDDRWGIMLWELSIGLNITQKDFKITNNYSLFFKFYDESDPQIIIDQCMPNRILTMIHWCSDLNLNEFEIILPYFYEEKKGDVVRALNDLLWYQLKIVPVPPLNLIYYPELSPWYQKIHQITDHFGITSADFQDPKYSEYFDKYIASQPI